MFRWGSRCGACVVLRIPREPRVKRSGFGQLVSGAGRRLVGSLGFGRVGVPVATWLGSPPAIYPNIGMVFFSASLSTPDVEGDVRRSRTLPKIARNISLGHPSASLGKPK